MNIPEKNLYQQVHPARLVTDWTTGFFACYLLWQQDLITAVVIAFIPSLIVSFIVIKFGDLEKIKNSAFGKYFKRTYDKSHDLIRLGGFITMGISAWYQSFGGMGLGLAIIVISWVSGMFSNK